MSSSYSSRPRTPPGPPPSSSSHRKSRDKNSSSGGRSHRARDSSSGRASSSSGSKMPPPQTGGIYSYSSAPEKLHKSSYPLSSPKSSASYASDKYIKSNAVRKSSEKVSSSDKYSVSKSDPYMADSKPRILSSTSSYVSDHYLGKEVYPPSRYPPESKGVPIYPEKFRSASDNYSDGNYSSVNNKKYYDSYDSYGGKTSHYPKMDGDPYYSGGSRSGYGAYGAYDEPAGAGGGYGGDKMGGGGGGRLRAAYPEDERKSYRDYSPPPIRSTRSPLGNRSGTRYNDYGHFSPPPQTSERLNRYVIGDSVVYGDKEYYPNLRPPSPRGRPPSPPTQPMGRIYSRYSDNSPRRSYSNSISGRSPLSGVPRTPPYRSPSPLTRRPPSPARRPPSPPSRRPPSPDNSYLRAPPRSSQDASYERSRVKDSYKSTSKNRVSSSSPRRMLPREPTHTDRHHSDGGKSLKEKESKRELDKRSRDRDRNNKHIPTSSPAFRNSSVPRKKDSQVAISQSKDRVDIRNNKRARPPVIRNGREESSRDRKDDTSRERDKPRRIEDRLGPNPNSVGNHRRSPVRGRVARRANSPTRDKKRGRRPDDLRLWIESRKNESGSKRPLSPNRSRLPAAKRLGRAGDRNAQPGNKRARIDPKKRLGNKGRRKGLLMNRRNKILKKYGKLNAAKRGARGDGGGYAKNKDNKDDGNRGKIGSSGSNRRFVHKPPTRNISRVNLLPVKPRVLKKPVQKLLQDPKENEKRKSEERQSSHTAKEFSPSIKEDKQSNSNREVATEK
ncbi:unnamed protein product [Meganyctiphanes norvegica]|uniref:Uncharacterized protein n=1 Tax=Meganyctiphanes norvegica TaxID=48144 RepID=A0AAV2QTJ6_MEGNR